MRTTSPKRPEVGEEATAVVRAPVVPSKMMAAVLYGSEDLRLEKIDVPPLAADEVLLRVRLALTDGTDLKVWQRGYHAKMIQPPAVFGHEVVGEIAAVGKRVDARWRIGLRVIAANDPVTKIEFPAAAVGIDEKEILGSYSAAVDIQETAAALVLQKKLPVMDIVTHRFPLDKIQEALELAVRPTAQSLKILITHL